MSLTRVNRRDCDSGGDFVVAPSKVGAGGTARQHSIDHGDRAMRCVVLRVAVLRLPYFWPATSRRIGKSMYWW